MKIKRSRAALLSLFFVFKVLVSGHTFAEEPLPPPEVFIQEWNLKPSPPAGWIKLDEKAAYITTSKDADVFMLMKADVSLVLAWFRFDVGYWHMNIIESMLIQDVLDYGVRIEQIGLSIDNQKIFLGVEGTEAITIYEWDRKRRIFSVKIP